MSEEKDKQEINSESLKNKKLPILLMVTAGILATVLIALVVLFYVQRRNMIEMETLLTEEKDSLTNELVLLMHGYDTLKTNNDTLNVQLEEEQKKIERLLGINASNVQKIRTYRKEVSTMREIMKSYIIQIDSLNTRNKILIAENTQIRKQMDSVERTNIELSQEKEMLSLQVEIASVIKARNIIPHTLNKKRKDTDKLSRFVKLEVEFILNENPIVEAGKKTVYMRITRPDGLIITSSPDNLFAMGDEMMIFTETRTVEYLNKDVEMSIFVDNSIDFIAGTYTIDLYLTGNHIGTSNFLLRGKN